LRQTAARDAELTIQQAGERLAAAERARTDAEREAEALRVAVHSEVERLQGQAREDAARLMREAEKRASRVERNLTTRIDSLLADARARYARLTSLQKKALQRLAELERMIHNVRAEIPDEADVARVLLDAGAPEPPEEAVVPPPAVSETARNADMRQVLQDVEQPVPSATAPSGPHKRQRPRA
jgi:hypothetical protein